MKQTFRISEILEPNHPKIIQIEAKYSHLQKIEASILHQLLLHQSFFIVIGTPEPLSHQL